MLDLARRLKLLQRGTRRCFDAAFDRGLGTRMHDAIFRDSDGDHPRVVEFHADQQLLSTPVIIELELLAGERRGRGIIALVTVQQLLVDAIEQR